MALGSKKSKKKSSGNGGKKEARYVNIMQILEGQARDGEEAKPYAKAQDYKGRLIWESQGEDGEESTFYEIKTAFIGEPHESAPEFVLQTLVVNLNNPKAAQRLED